MSDMEVKEYYEGSCVIHLAKQIKLYTELCRYGRPVTSLCATEGGGSNEVIRANQRSAINSRLCAADREANKVIQANQKSVLSARPVTSVCAAEGRGPNQVIRANQRSVLYGRPNNKCFNNNYKCEIRFAKQVNFYTKLCPYRRSINSMHFRRRRRSYKRFEEPIRARQFAT